MILNTQYIETFRHLGVAVSGGGDSLALMILLAEWAKENGRTIRAITVDHGLRPEARDEARHVGICADALGIGHDVIRWDGDKSGNIYDKARRARHKLLSEWAKSNAIEAICFGHTADDIVETFIMRLSRGAGIDGLAAMKAQRKIYGIFWLRPLLDAWRADLRRFLQSRNIGWCEDSSNEDTRYHRVRIRKELGTLTALGLDSKNLHKTALCLRQTADSLAHQAANWLRTSAEISNGEIKLSLAAFRALSADMQFRIICGLTKWLNGRNYPPRGESVVRLIENMQRKPIQCLGGCIFHTRANHDTLSLTRENISQPALPLKARQNLIYDRMWVVAASGDCKEGTLAPVGADGLRIWRAQSEQNGQSGRKGALSKYGAMATPGLWHGNTLIAAPILQKHQSISAEFIQDAPIRLSESFLR